MISVTDALLERRSTRAFLDRPVAARLVRDVIDIACRAPSSSNMQPWRLVAMTADDLDRLKAAVRQSLTANPMGEGSEYKIYPPDLKEPYNGHRRKCAEDMYATIGLPRENKIGRLMHFARNFDFFGAPVGMILSIDRAMEPGQWADLGIFLQSLLLLAHERGLATCPQAAWAAMHKTVRAHLGLPDELMVYCGISLGYADPTQPINSLRTDRASFAEIAELRGFASESEQIAVPRG